MEIYLEKCVQEQEGRGTQTCLCCRYIGPIYSTAVTVFYEYYYLLVHTCMVYAWRPTPQKRASPAVLRVSASPRVRVEGINLETLGSGTLPGSTCTLS